MKVKVSIICGSKGFYEIVDTDDLKNFYQYCEDKNITFAQWISPIEMLEDDIVKLPHCGHLIYCYRAFRCNLHTSYISDAFYEYEKEELTPWIYKLEHL